MNNVKRIRLELGLTQESMGKAMGCTQGNVSFYERGQAVPQGAAANLIAHGKTVGKVITFDDIYGPEREYTPPPKPAAKPSALAGINLVSPQQSRKTT